MGVSQCNLKAYFSLQVINPITSQFVLVKTQEQGMTLDDPQSIKFDVGETYTDRTKRLMIKCINDHKILVIFKSGLSFELTWWYNTWGDVEFVKIPQIYTEVGESHGIMGSTASENCELLTLCYSALLNSHLAT